MGGYGLFWVAVGDLVGDSVITSLLSFKKSSKVRHKHFKVAGSS